jgi:hypothetical protein
MFRSMFRLTVRSAGSISGIEMLVLGTVLLACPRPMLAQRGGGGGQTGGGTAGGGGLSSTGKATGVDVKDDLKDFHAALAAQATSPQILAYAAMTKSTEAANAELKAFLEQLGKAGSVSELATRSEFLEQAIEAARTENRKFIDGFSDQQKSGLKEITRRLIKADFDLAQQTRALDLEVRSAKAVGQSIASSAQSLERALTNFQSQQIALGDEMSIGAGKNSQDSAFNLPAVKNSVNFANQPVAITTTGVISRGTADGGQNTFKLELTADLSDLQLNIAQVLRTQLDKSERCGERIAIQNATLTPATPASLVVVQLHFERWACPGRDVNEMVEGNGTIEVKLTPSVGADGTLRLVPEIGRVDAPGLIGELLRSGSLGETLRDKITELLLSTVRRGGDFSATLPPAARGGAALHRSQFQGTGSGKLLAVLDGEIQMSNEQVISLISELKERRSAPETVQATVPR